ncbi:carotenoid oxygenase family protein [Aquiflexum sp.]|uniref:carotenoid oxygenase family protein n=1 Tax=Aquiflexum sp. TaxID=1872584 RepID=UPI003594841D
MKKKKNLLKRVFLAIKKLLTRDPESNLPTFSERADGDYGRQGLLTTSREEFEAELQILEGTLPDDIFGAFYVSLPVGSVNSGGLPFVSKNPDGSRNAEHGSPIMNGDGMVILVDLNHEPAPLVKTKLMKTPCYYADEATKWGTKHHGLMGFHNMGITRMSMVFGARNELNTATVPVRFKGQNNSSILATYDVGRPFMLDPKSLEIVTPVGKSSEWMNAQPAMVPWPFGIAQTSAHPVFDPITKELFTVNYSRDKSSFTHMEQTIHHLRTNRDEFQSSLEALAKELVDHPDHFHVKAKVHDFFKNLSIKKNGADKEPKVKGEVFMYLFKWDGNGPIQRWDVEDQTGEKLIIDECMHQMGITEDFIILTDCAFKFAMDLLFDNPFPGNKLIERLIRRLATVRMEPFTHTYIIKKSEIIEGAEKVTAYKLKNPIPLETIHYSCDYANPGGIITLYGVHNAATCIAEWVRTFDRRATDGKPVDPEYYSLFAVGSMDISRLGKWKINTNTWDIDNDNSIIYENPGNYEEDNLGPNTWTIVLYTYRDMISSDKVVPTIKQLWYVSDGTDNNLLTKFVYRLYKNYPHRKLKLKEIKKVTKKELPFSVTRINLQTMQPEDYYQCAPKTYIRGVQFIPRKTPNPGIPEELDGYLFAPVEVGIESGGIWSFTSQFWIFDAQDIAKGPICKMGHEKLVFGFTLHTSWLPQAATNEQQYIISIKEDYEEVIDNIPMKADREFLKKFFEAHIYDHFS